MADPREIVQLAHADAAPNFDLINYLAHKCCADEHGGKVPNHGSRLVNALNAARSKARYVVAHELDRDV